MDLNKFILEKYDVKVGRLPVEIPDMGRNQLAELFAELGFIEGAEIGVESGAYSEVLCKANPKLHLNCIDAWITYKGYRDYTRPETIAGFYENAQKTLSQYNTTLIRKFSMDAVKDFKDESLDFVYIDGNHTFQFVTNDICLLYNPAVPLVPDDPLFPFVAVLKPILSPVENVPLPVIYVTGKSSTPVPEVNVALKLYM